ncbi:hypothetical protein [Sulfuritalea sp.]|uniref:hypothetical protein n=1 Tax=Sulfuritalea sp. TaxID=2480090 RepID=UPI001AC1DCFC|nr:hypothetical protein [Sulfuritalea sp.]MBN8476053.1 hypothetical protein [Sulfuritalea sp.]
MIFEFLVAYQRTDDAEIVATIRDCLAKVLEDNLNEFDDEAVERMIIPRLERLGDYVADVEGNAHRRAQLGFALDLPEETENIVPQARPLRQ